MTGVELRLCGCWVLVVGETALRRLEQESFLLSREALEVMELSRPEEEYRRMSYSPAVGFSPRSQISTEERREGGISGTGGGGARGGRGRRRCKKTVRSGVEQNLRH